MTKLWILYIKGTKKKLFIHTCMKKINKIVLLLLFYYLTSTHEKGADLNNYKRTF